MRSTKDFFLTDRFQTLTMGWEETSGGFDRKERVKKVFFERHEKISDVRQNCWIKMIGNIENVRTKTTISFEIPAQQINPLVGKIYS